MKRWKHLETPRCLLRLPQLSDAARIVRYYVSNRDHLTPFEPIRPPGFHTEPWWRDRIPGWHEEFLQDQSLRLFVFRRSEPETIIGSVSFTNIVRGVLQGCSLGFSIAAEWEGRGYMRESVQAGIDYMFAERKLHRIMASHLPRNERSGGLLKRLGFVVEGLARDYIRINGRWEDHVLTSLVNSDWSEE